MKELRERAGKRVKKESWVRREVVEAVFEELLKLIVEKVKAGEEIKIKEFGKFYAVERKPRDMVDPKTGKRIGTIGRRKVFVFKPSKKIKVLEEE
ncbi:HU family DNA-binding protein [Balnearium lithotrophicum]|uniref:HU family DNA-binding protein n=1 Tax=Balnearium lithotrophicum TaxID=223788 RepID=UPI00163DB4F3|nr:HU family DNA-binding protein [Balnearium lithotrophicum]